jgi:ribosomal protein L16 Arg81 hydroxylase
MPGRRVAKAYVSVEPETKGFGEKLREDITTGQAKKSTERAGKKIGKDLAKQISGEAGKLLPIDTSQMTAQSKRLSDVMEEGLRRRAPEMGKIFVKEFSKDLDKDLTSATRRPLDNFQRQSKLAARLAAEDMLAGFRETFHEHPDLIDRSTLVGIERFMGDEFGDMGATMARRFNADLLKEQAQQVTATQREMEKQAKEQADAYVRAQAQALRENKEFDRELRAKAREQARIYDQAWSSALKENKDFDRALKDRVTDVAKAMEEALKFDKDRTEKIRRDNRGFLGKLFEGVLTDFQTALGRVSGGWTKLLLNPIGLAIVGSAIVYVVVFVNALIVALTAAAVGVGAIIAAAMILKAEPAMATALERIGGQFKSMFVTMAKPMESSLVRAFEIVGANLGPLQRLGQQIFTGISGQVETLARGTVDLIRNVMAGVANSLPAIQAVLMALGRELPKLGKYLGAAFQNIMKDPDRLAKTMEGLVEFVGKTAVGISAVMNVLIAIFDKLRTGFRGMGDAVKGLWSIATIDPKGALSSWKQWWNDVSGHTDRVAQDIRKHELQIADDTAKLMRDINGMQLDLPTDVVEAEFQRMVGLFGEGAIAGEGFKTSLIKNLQAIAKQMKDTLWTDYAKEAVSGFHSIDVATKETVKAVDDLIDKLEILNKRFIAGEDAVENFYDIQQRVTDEMTSDGGMIRAFDDFSKSGREHQKLFREQAAAVEQIIKTTLKQGGTLQQVNDIYTTYSEQIIKNGVAFGQTTEQAQAYLVQLGLTPESILTELALAGMPEAITELEKLTGKKVVPIGVEADVNQFASVGEYIVQQITGIGGVAGETFAEFMTRKTATGFYDRQNNWRLIGGWTATTWQEGVAASNAPTRAAESVTKQLHEGLDQGKSGNYNDGLSTAQRVAEGISVGAKNLMPTAATSMVNALSAGLKSLTSADAIKGAGSFLAGLFSAAFHSSPAKYGPLSGHGDMLYVGQDIAARLAQGLIAGEDKVAKASARVAGAIAMGGSYGMSVGSEFGISPYAFNVYVGDHALNEFIDYRVERYDENTARGLIAGRSTGA